jgi:PDZ domain-containing protein
MDIEIDTGKVGGPSAGLAFTLAILDRLTPGSLTGGDRMAVTGTIELDGTVGPVGGVDHKTEAAISEGAEVFLVPPEEFEQAKKAARGRIKIEQVQTLDDALAALVAHGGDPLPTDEK